MFPNMLFGDFKVKSPKNIRLVDFIEGHFIIFTKTNKGAP